MQYRWRLVLHRYRYRVSCKAVSSMIETWYFSFRCIQAFKQSHSCWWWSFLSKLIMKIYRKLTLQSSTIIVRTISLITNSRRKLRVRRKRSQSYRPIIPQTFVPHLCNHRLIHRYENISFVTKLINLKIYMLLEPSMPSKQNWKQIMSQNKLNNGYIWLQPLVTADLQANCILAISKPQFILS